jgi:hypothetical protein
MNDPKKRAPFFLERNLRDIYASVTHLDVAPAISSGVIAVYVANESRHVAHRASTHRNAQNDYLKFN